MAGNEISHGTIDDFLLSLAAGVRVAQKELSRPAGDGESASGISYHLPRLDFELRTTVSLTTSPVLANRYKQFGVAKPAGNQFLIMAPIASTAEPVSTQMVSTISGSLVAVPANQGMPPALVRSTVVKKSATVVDVTVEVVDVTGVPKVGVEVHFDVDRDASRRPNGAAIASSTAFKVGVVATDEAGKARSTLKVTAGESVGTRIVAVLEALGQMEQITYVK